MFRLADRYGSMALVPEALLNKPKLVASDYGITYPFRELGWGIGEEINPTLYAKQQWNSWTYLPFYKNVEKDKIVLL